MWQGNVVIRASNEAFLGGDAVHNCETLQSFWKSAVKATQVHGAPEYGSKWVDIASEVPGMRSASSTLQNVEESPHVCGFEIGKDLSMDLVSDYSVFYGE